MSKRRPKVTAHPKDDEVVRVAAENQRLHGLAVDQGVRPHHCTVTNFGYSSSSIMNSINMCRYCLKHAILPAVRSLQSLVSPLALSVSPPLFLSLYSSFYVSERKPNPRKTFAAFLKSGGKDIVKRSSARRSRYLLVFNCLLAPAAAGRLGTLARLDSRNPVMYIDFPGGRLRLNGTLTFPRNKYVVLRMGNKDVLCEDVLESIIIFSEAQWVGTAEENPREIPLPMPETLKLRKLHSSVDFSARGGQVDIERGATQEPDDFDDEDEGALPASQATGRVSRHTTQRKRRLYVDSNNDSSLGHANSNGNEEEVRKLPRKKVAASRQKSGCGSQPSQAESRPNMADLSSNSDDDERLAARTKKNSTRNEELLESLDPSNGKIRAAKKVAAKENRDNNGIEILDLVSSEQDDGNEAVSGSIPSIRRSRRAAAGAASKKLKISYASDESGWSGNDEEGEEDDESEDENSASEESEASESVDH